MKGKKVINIKTSAFELTINWNGPLVTTQIAILLGLVLIRVFARNDAVVRMCTVLLIIDILVILFTFLFGLKATTSEEGDKKPEKETMDIEVNSDKEKKEDKTEKIKKTKYVVTSKGEIKNKVAIPNPSASRHGRQMGIVNKPQPKPVETKEEEVKILEPEMTVESPVSASPTSIKMEECDWDSLFSMEDD